MIASIDFTGIGVMLTGCGAVISAVLTARIGRRVKDVHATQSKVKEDLDDYNGRVEEALTKIAEQVGAGSIAPKGTPDDEQRRET